MRLQHIKDVNGKDAGVFIPIEDWSRLKILYPDIESAGTEIPDWHKVLLDERLTLTSDHVEEGDASLAELKTPLRD